MLYDSEKLTRFAASAGESLGMPPKEARIFGESLVYADMRGLGSHGLMRASTYAKRIQMGLVKANAVPRITRDGGAMIAVDGDNGQGVCVAQRVMELCVERAENLGVSMAFVNNCNHFGCSAYFTEYAAWKNMIGFAVTNSYRAVAPTGGSAPMLGTNPLSLAIPGGTCRPFVLDMATSLVAQGKVILARKEGRSVPLGWGLDQEGKPSTDPNEILSGGTLLPFGGPKGYGIALAIEILCTCVAGAAKSTEMGSMYNFERTQNTGFILGAFDLSKVVDMDRFGESVSQLFEEIKSSPKAEAVSEIFIPGEIEDRKYLRAKEEGIELSDAVAGELQDLAKELGIPFECSK